MNACVDGRKNYLEEFPRSVAEARTALATFDKSCSDDVATGVLLGKTEASALFLDPTHCGWRYRIDKSIY